MRGILMHLWIAGKGEQMIRIFSAGSVQSNPGELEVLKFHIQKFSSSKNLECEILSKNILNVLRGSQGGDPTKSENIDFS